VQKVTQDHNNLQVTEYNIQLSLKSSYRFIWNQKLEYILWNTVSAPLLQFARYCSTVQTLSLKYLGRDLDLEVTW